MKILKEIQKRTFPSLIALTALSVSASAAFYSVSGLSKLFAGASFEVMIMAGSLEVAKLVIASLLYQYWGQLNKILRTYLTVAATVLVLITSAGIYGFLSAAYQDTATKSGIVDKETEVLELKKNRFVENRDFLLGEKKQLDESITSLRTGLANNTVQYVDKTTGQLITTTSSANRRALQTQLDAAVAQRDNVSMKLEVATDSITSIEVRILETTSESELASELGPLKYLSELTGTPMNKIINILLLVIIFVFDPLAISLVVAANFAFDKLTPNKKDEEDIEQEEVQKIEEPTPGPQPMFLNEEILNHLEKLLNKKVVEVADINEPDSEQEVEVDEEEIDEENLIDEDFYRWEKQSAEELHLRDIEKDFEPEIIFSDEDELSDWDVTLSDGLEDEEWDEEHALDMVLNQMLDDLEEGVDNVTSIEDLSDEVIDEIMEGDEFETEETTIFEEKDEDLGEDTVYEEDKMREVEPPTQIVNKSPYLRVGNRIIPRNVRYNRGE